MKFAHTLSRPAGRARLLLVCAGVTFLIQACTPSATQPLVTASQSAALPASTKEPAEKSIAIVVSERADFRERLAAQELQRYLARLGGKLPEVLSSADDHRGYAATIFVGQEETHPQLANLVAAGRLPPPEERPRSEGYVIQTVEFDGQPAIAVLGSDPAGALYGSYRLLEEYGIRFYLGRDILPPSQADFEVLELDLREEPWVRRRGLLPWHDFLNGPSAYSLEDFQRYINQMVKMRMNTLILHNYAGGGTAGDVTEPFMSFTCDGELHPGRLDTSIDNQRWKLAASRADDLAFASGDYFSHDVMASDAARFTAGQAEEKRNTFAKAQAMMQQIVAYGAARGVEVVLATDFDIIPSEFEGKCDALDPDVLRRRLDGILETYPSLHYIQMYFSELNELTTAQGIEAYQVLHAHLAAKAPGVRLITGSWFQEERFPEMNAALPRDIVFSSLLPIKMKVEPEWAAIQGDRETWAIPWMEFDSGLSEPQLAIARMEERLPALRRAGVDGMFGILWRERAAEANVAYLAQDSWRPPGDALASETFYEDFARANFGAAAAKPGARALRELEKEVHWGAPRVRLATSEFSGWSFCCPDSAPGYAAVYQKLFERFAALSPRVEAPSQRENLEFWSTTLAWLERYWTARWRVPRAEREARPEAKTHFLVDAGGSGDGDLEPDRWFKKGSSGRLSAELLGDDLGYPQALKTWRWHGGGFGYRFPIPEGYDRYRVELFFVERRFRNSLGNHRGRRPFQIRVDRRKYVSNFDIAEKAGGPRRGTKLALDVPVPADRLLDVDFIPLGKNAKVSALRVFPIDARGQPLPPDYFPRDPALAWTSLGNSGFREAIENYQRSVRDLPLLGGLASASGGRWYRNDDCETCIQDPYLSYEEKITDRMSVAPPSRLRVRGTLQGAQLDWAPPPGRDDEVAGYNVYRAHGGSEEFSRRNDEPLTEPSYLDPASGTFRYTVTTLDQRGSESPPSYEETVAAGEADQEPPRVLMLPATDQALRGEDYPVRATLIDDRAANLLSAKLQWRPLGSASWREVPMRPNVVGRANTFVAAIPSYDLTSAAPVEYRVVANDGINTTPSPRHTLTVVEPMGPRPQPTGDLRVLQTTNATDIHWEPGTDAFLYRIYRGQTPEFEPGPASYLTYVPARQHAFRDTTTGTADARFYRVVPVSAAGRTPRTDRD